MINRVVLTGRITKDIELRYTSSNLAVAKFTLAVDRTFSKDNETDFIQIVAWRKQAENVTKFCHKGSLIACDGRIQTGSYDDKDGKRVYTSEVVADSIAFLDPKQQGNEAQREIYKDIELGQEKQKRNEPPIDVFKE